MDEGKKKDAAWETIRGEGWGILNGLTVRGNVRTPLIDRVVKNAKFVPSKLYVSANVASQ